MSEVDPTRCPRCKQSNQCGQQLAPGSACWCFELVIAAQTIQSLPAAAQGQACLCRACAGEPLAQPQSKP